MNVLFHIANAMVMPPAIFFAYHFYKFKGNEIPFRRFWISIALLIITVAITSMQFVFPEIIPALNRNREALASGEIWRTITPLFIQPAGLGQCFFNALFFISFVPIAEMLYGRFLLMIYFGVGILVQFINIYWETTPGGLVTSGGGSSPALYGIIGSLLTYVVVNRALFPKGYLLIPISGFVGAVILVFFEDGHAPSLLAGGLLGIILSGYSQPITAFPREQIEHPNN